MSAAEKKKKKAEDAKRKAEAEERAHLEAEAERQRKEMEEKVKQERIAAEKEHARQYDLGKTTNQNPPLKSLLCTCSPMIRNLDDVIHSKKVSIFRNQLASTTL